MLANIEPPQRPRIGATSVSASTPTLKASVRCRPDLKNARYQQTLKQGDLLLGRLQKLSKVVDVE